MEDDMRVTLVIRMVAAPGAATGVTGVAAVVAGARPYLAGTCLAAVVA
jgi:hypothetical protein